ncbi:NAD-P-binding protein [Trametes punicea]|nr:NAD-P-binding protein [Trametes punicea]
MASKKVILVTGINGFLGTHIVDQAVKAGYRVRGTVRSNNVDSTRETNAIYGADVEVMAIDNLAYDDFTDALRGVDAVIHAAAPLPGGDTPHNALTAAVEGTVNILRQTHKMGIKRFITLSTFMNVRRVHEYNVTWTENDWVDINREEALKSNDPFEVYLCEKVLAERALWEFAADHPDIDITSLNPGYFIGPYADTFRLKDALISQLRSNFILYRLLSPTSQPFLPVLLSIDVRDAARAAVHAITSPPASEVGQKRLLLLPHVVGWKDVAEHIGEARPELRDRLSTVALSGELLPTPSQSPVDNSRSVNILKLGKLTDWKTSVLAAVDAIIEAEKMFAKQGKTFH